MGSPRFIMAMSIYSYTGLPGQCGCRLIVSDNFHSCFFIPDLCGCRLCASDMSGLMRLLIYASAGLFFPSSTFFSGYFCTFLCSLPVLHCARSRSGGVRCVVFYKHDLAFVPFSFFHPLHVGEQSVEYPQWVISIPTDKSRWLNAVCS